MRFMSSIAYLPIGLGDELLEEVKSVLDEALQLGGRSAELEGGSGLLGCVPELDSMAVITLVAELEERFGFVVNDDELVGDIFATLDSLTQFVASKVDRSAV
jgi:acyl carrier protein